MSKSKPSRRCQIFPLRPSPLVKSLGVAQGKAFEEIAAIGIARRRESALPLGEVTRRRPRPRGFPASLDQPHVENVIGGRIEGEAVALDQEMRDIREMVAQGLAKVGQGAAQRCPSPFGVALRPESVASFSRS